jgi:hypothetical protein
MQSRRLHVGNGWLPGSSANLKAFASSSLLECHWHSHCGGSPLNVRPVYAREVASWGFAHDSDVCCCCTCTGRLLVQDF